MEGEEREAMSPHTPASFLGLLANGDAQAPVIQMWDNIAEDEHVCRVPHANSFDSEGDKKKDLLKSR